VNLGADPKKTAWLAGILVIGGGLIYYADFSSSDSSGPAPAVSTSHTPAPAASRSPVRLADRRRVTNQGLIQDWKPRLGPKNPEDRPDPATIDPTLHLDLLAKVQAVEAAPAGRNLFVFGTPPAPPPTAAMLAMPKVGQIAVNHPAPPPPVINPGPPPAPTAPAMTFKYYGYKVSKTDGHKAAFLLDGDDILIAGENDTVKRRYKVVKIGVNSITIEDTQFKSTQTLQLQENPSA
jgi:hypothetical protein